MQTGGLILIVLGILIVYGAVTGKLDYFLMALNTAYQHDDKATGTAQNTSFPANAPNVDSILPKLKIPTFGGGGNPKADMIFT